MQLAEQFRQRVNSGQTLIGTFVMELESPAVVTALGNCGMDFFIIDAEHGTFSPSQIRRIIEAGNCHKICPLTRIAQVDRGLTTQILDAGAAGVLLAQVRSMDEVLALVDVTKYPPLGKRGVHLLRPHTNFRSPKDPVEFLRQANENLITAIQIETREAVEMIDQIAGTDGVDMLYVGPGDLSVALGHPFDFAHPKLDRVLDRVVQACCQYGKISACHADSVNTMALLKKKGYQVLGYAAEMRLFLLGVQDFVHRVRNALEAKPNLASPIAAPVGT